MGTCFVGGSTCTHETAIIRPLPPPPAKLEYRVFLPLLLAISCFCFLVKKRRTAIFLTGRQKFLFLPLSPSLPFSGYFSSLAWFCTSVKLVCCLVPKRSQQKLGFCTVPPLPCALWKERKGKERLFGNRSDGPSQPDRERVRIMFSPFFFLQCCNFCNNQLEEESTTLKTRELHFLESFV